MVFEKKFPRSKVWSGPGSNLRNSEQLKVLPHYSSIKSNSQVALNAYVNRSLGAFACKNFALAI
ncbi:hypothetical protein H5410_019304 [Solanum commersonii]|uniref:Uncharacterized protein n=1 Tax=Solanum commersonii TaxID=4109 RepID=A0A9J6A527_SOLCO|nr:hypothetical protein H5410_019304 [Solanum commersonii]